MRKKGISADSDWLYPEIGILIRAGDKFPFFSLSLSLSRYATVWASSLSLMDGHRAESFS